MPKPRIRTIKPELADSEKVARLSDEAFRVWICGITQADDAGTFPASDGHLLRYLGFRGEPRRFAAVRGELSREGFVVFYTARGATYGRIHDWGVHQRIDNARKDANDYYPAPGDGIAITRFPAPSSLSAASRGEPPPPADARREPPRAAAGSDPDREGKGPGEDQDPVAASATGRRAKRPPLPYRASEVYELLVRAMDGAFIAAMPQGEDIPSGIAIAVNKVLREASRLGYTLADFELAGEYTVTYARALGSQLSLTPAWVAQTDPNKGGLLKAVLNARGWAANGRPPLGRNIANGPRAVPGAVTSGDELRAMAAEMRARGVP